ncbi:hypothetical protein AWB81_06425 [Caballeronia arationis]|nr:hypothetical protein AWB81_06425 [Caballeronia arationis]
MFSIRGRRIPPVVVTCAVIFIAINAFQHRRHDGPQQLRDVLEDVVHDGGTIVRCQQGICKDMNDGEEVGNGRDGFYVLFPQAADTEQKLSKYQERVRRAIL